MSAAPDEPLPPAAFVVALATLPRMGPARLDGLLAGRDPATTWSLVRAGDGRLVRAASGLSAEVVADWRAAAGSVDVAEVWHRHRGVTVLLRDGPGFPARLVDDPEPPAALFAAGGPVPEGPAVAIVGTRRCTAYGRRVAFELAAQLSEAGVSVASGLALGIDGAAHRGSLAAGAAEPIGVVATGLDQPYPRRHAALWAELARRGVLLGEAPLGTGPARWRFPARNRILAGLADAVVVVETPGRGGSLHTVAAAIERDVPVLAVPGPIHSPASEGTNRLLAEGCAPVCDVTDVLVAIGLERAGPSPRPGAGAPAGDAVAADPAAERVLAAMGWSPVTVGTVAAGTGAGVPVTLVRLEALERAGRVRREGAWWERR